MQTPEHPRLSRLSRLADFFGLKHNLIILLTTIFVLRRSSFFQKVSAQLD